MKYKNDNMERDDDIDAVMYAAFSCVDCGQEFGSREELEAHENTSNMSKPGE
jgi:hypothetical protein